MILVSLQDAPAHSIKEYAKDSNKIVVDYTLPLYLVPVSLIVTCFCLIGHEMLHIAAMVPAPLWWKECLEAFTFIRGIEDVYIWKVL